MNSSTVVKTTAAELASKAEASVDRGQTWPQATKQKNHHLVKSNLSWLGSRRYYRRFWTTRTGHLRLMSVKRHPEMEDQKREMQKVIGHSRKLLVMPPPAQSIQTPGLENLSLEDGPVKLQLLDHEMTTSFLDVRKDGKAISLIVPFLQIVNSDSHFRNEILRHEDQDGMLVFLQVPQIFIHEDEKIDHFAEDVTCVDN